MSVSIALIRAHLNLDHDQDDALLAHYANVSAMWVAAYTGHPFDADNALMTQAALLLIAHSYESREAISYSNPYQLPFGVRDLLAGVKQQVLSAEDEPAPDPQPEPCPCPDPDPEQPGIPFPPQPAPITAIGGIGEIIITGGW